MNSFLCENPPVALLSYSSVWSSLRWKPLILLTFSNHPFLPFSPPSPSVTAEQSARSALKGASTAEQEALRGSAQAAGWHWVFGSECATTITLIQSPALSARPALGLPTWDFNSPLHLSNVHAWTSSRSLSLSHLSRWKNVNFQPFFPRSCFPSPSCCAWQICSPFR